MPPSGGHRAKPRSKNVVCLLPYLAWALSVDRWDERWTEHAKRAVIKASFFVHQHKGTIGALRHAVEPLGYLIQVDEWWQHTPPGPRGTFSLHIGILDSGMSDAMHQELDRLIDDVKPLSRHLAGLAIHLSTDGACRVASAAYLGDILTVYPYTATELTVHSHTRVASATHFIDTLSIYP